MMDTTPPPPTLRAERARRPGREQIEGTDRTQQSFAGARQGRDAQFRRLPNPDLVMYVFPHPSPESGYPVPGYSTVLPMYERVEYALPGEAEGWQ